MSSTRDFKAFNARLPVAAVRFQSRDEWLLVVNEAQRRGISLSALLRTLAIEGAARGRVSSHQQAHRTLATKRTA